MSRVLVVGAGSPLGTAVGAALAAEGHEVHGVSRRGRGKGEMVDITEPKAARELLQRIRPVVVVYLARPELPTEDVEAAIESASDAVGWFATQCHEEGAARILFASSAAVYGTAAVAPRSEDDPTPAPGPYAQLKLRSERALDEVARAIGIVAVSLRIFNVYGPGFSGSLVNRLADASTGGAPPTVFATDGFVRDYVHRDDVAAAFTAAAASPALDSGVLNVGTGVGTGNLELLSLIPGAQWLPGSELGAPSVSVADVSRLRTALGVSPIPLIEALRRRG
ncbi:MAG TPA: NAD(P)-dependent oxidoreductase [Aeromicrobium sp.]|nr:NAD(P)-dependent oxidoreductase [Aeromicrobium sp.]